MNGLYRNGDVYTGVESGSYQKLFDKFDDKNNGRNAARECIPTGAELSCRLSRKQFKHLISQHARHSGGTQIEYVIRNLFLNHDAYRSLLDCDGATLAAAISSVTIGTAKA